VEVKKKYYLLFPGLPPQPQININGFLIYTTKPVEYLFSHQISRIFNKKSAKTYITQTEEYNLMPG